MGGRKTKTIRIGVIVAAIIVPLLVIGGNVSAESYINIYEDSTTYAKIGSSTPAPGKIYMVSDITIENHGYDEVETNPYRFKVSIDHVEYDHSSATYFYLEDIGKAALDSVTLRDGGKISGSLIYEVPKGTNKYGFRYDAYDWEDFDVRYL